MKFNVLNRWSGEMQFTAEIDCADDALPSIKMGLAVRWAKENSANLDGANLDGANLYGANLTRANLDGANLTRANLDGANLTRANLTRANLDGANLTRANLTRANLYGANLTRANLTRANLYGANLTRANLDGANLTRANLDGANLDGANLTRANLDGANLDGANLDGQPIIDGGLRSDGYRFLLTNFPEEGPRVKAGCRNLDPKEAIAHWKRTRKGTPIGDESLLIVAHMLAIAKCRKWKLVAPKAAA
jgi:hypothetical protein